MASKSQRRKERHEKKRKEKRKRQQQTQIEQKVFRHDDIPVPSNARHQKRLAEQIPVAWPGELPEDVAVFDDRALSQLPPDQAAQVIAVRQALNDALASRGDEASRQLANIPRSSSLSEWRLFIRGLTGWLEGAAEAASESWNRLSPDRRPGRIAAVLTLAARSDLDSMTAGHPPGRSVTQSSSGQEGVVLDEQQLHTASFVRRVRFERPALKIAESVALSPEEDAELLLGPRKIRWLKRFIEEYGQTEPELTSALSQTALGRIVNQKYSDLFELTARTIPGPRHDRRNLLLHFFFHCRYGELNEANKVLNEYLEKDLPQNTQISEPLRGAIASQIHLNEALAMIASERKRPSIRSLLESTPDQKPIENHLKAAIAAAPDNAPAHEAYSTWINSRLEDGDLRKSEQQRLENDQVEVMRKWAGGVPSAVEPRLWLVDYLLENEFLDEAKPHVEFLSASRLDDPRVRAVPWKWQLLDAMRLCRRKTWLADVPKRLDDAESIWPAWLSKDWLPYLRAAWLLRGGQREAYEKFRQELCVERGRTRDSLPDACMMLGAAQKFRVVPADLKPLREAVEKSVKKLASTSLQELIETAAFFWDLHRVQLVYPAYRSQAKNIGTAFMKLLKKEPKAIPKLIEEPHFQNAVFWASELRFWIVDYSSELPPFMLRKSVQRHPVYAAARLNSALKDRMPWRLDERAGDAELLREAATSQRDPYHRYWFAHLSDLYDEAVAKFNRRLSGFPFGFSFGDDEEDDDDFDFEEL